MAAAGENKVNSYLQQREALIAKDRSLRKDAALNASLSESFVALSANRDLTIAAPIQKQADEKLRALRKWEIDNLWKEGSAGPDDPSTDEIGGLFPGMGFLTGESANPSAESS
jgi:hypothetical protein